MYDRGVCIFCELPIVSGTSTTCVDGSAHVECWNAAAEARRAYAEECEDREGFAERALVRREVGSESFEVTKKGRVA